MLYWRDPLAVMAGLICFLAWVFSIAWSTTLILLFLLCILGLLISIMLAIHEFDDSNRFIHCKKRSISRKSECVSELRRKQVRDHST